MHRNHISIIVQIHYLWRLVPDYLSKYFTSTPMYMSLGHSMYLDHPNVVFFNTSNLIARLQTIRTGVR